MTQEKGKHKREISRQKAGEQEGSGMKAKEDAIKTALSRISVVQAYLSSPFPIDVFVSMYNSGGINRHMLKDTGLITITTLFRWTEKALTVAKDGANPLVRASAMMMPASRGIGGSRNEQL